MDTKILSFNSMVSDYEVINPEFARVKVYVCYAGRNRNHSSIDEEVLQKMSKTIYGVPMVAEYDEDNNCFKGHGGKLEITDDGIDYVQTTVPYGFVDPKTPVFYEEVVELDGITKHNYLCCYAYLWYKRYPEVEKVLKNQDNKKIGQSMEINVDSYEIDDDGYCVIKDGYFSALAMLGVEPCFESASVTSKFSKESDSIWEEMILSFRKYTEYDGGGSEMDELKEFNEEVNEDEDFKKKRCSEEEDEDFKKKKCSEEEEEEDEDFKKKKCSEEENVEEDYQAKYEEVNNELISLKAKYSDLQAEYEDLKDRYTVLESEVAELRDFALEENVFSKFEVLKNVEGYEAIYNARYDLSEEDLVLRLKALAYDNGIVVGKKANRREKEIKKFSLDVNNPKNNKGKVTEWDTLNLNKK